MFVSRQVTFAKREIQLSHVQFCSVVTDKSLHIPDKRMTKDLVIHQQSTSLSLSVER